jgi:hypothetical protein
MCIKADHVIHQLLGLITCARGPEVRPEEVAIQLEARIIPQPCMQSAHYAQIGVHRSASLKLRSVHGGKHVHLCVPLLSVAPRVRGTRCAVLTPAL